MRLYGKIETGFWRNPKVRNLSERARLLLAYLMSCPHGNSIGCFVLPLGYISADMGWSDETVTETVSELLRKPFIERDETTNLVRIIGWWGHNTIENPNVAKAVATSVKALPDCELKQDVIRELNSLETLNEKVSETLSKQLPKPFRNPEPNLTYPEPKPEPEIGRASAPADVVFRGSYVLTVKEKDLSGWLRSYSTLDREDMLAEIALCDQYHSASDDPPPRWFFTASAWLKRIHDSRMKSKRDEDEAERRIYAGVQ